ncbi:hypothetical protein B0H63DRAFT_512819 [Podospora didyma]|uniref:Peptidase S33 tripeptidyl aminopeptidase-like C-terminal domain-containing protein n=1 Tax=Podospora didyma TaxID=330526 RepID=A0AAE0N923_9PEZI|nr:hypothetical protein B0H63DRAFT_512819 [Podospora didyma]
MLRGAGLCRRRPQTHISPDYPWEGEATSGVSCGDSATSASSKDTRNNPVWAQELVSLYQTQSPTFRPKYVFSGPFGSETVRMLILSNRCNPATPLTNAYALSRLHGGSVVVVQDADGHCAAAVAERELHGEDIQDVSCEWGVSEE